MSPNEWTLWFAGTAIAISLIVVTGFLGAFQHLHMPHRHHRTGHTLRH